jgi:aspartyl-tRNA(Asn)/glutamyl-tRNA(Gln) amidotransferase subunit A
MNKWVSASERLEMALARIASPELEGSKAFTDVFAETARREAAAAASRLPAGKSLGPLDGRIVSIKALFDVAGTVTHAGSAILRTQEPALYDAPVVKRLREAGAVIIGKSQMTEFAFSALGTNPHDGVPGNPRDRSRVPGGSSSGGVVSVIDSMAEIAIGSDTGGSIRIPSALSGAVGFKPTSGRVPTDGAFSLSSSLDTVGPIATSVTDCALADQVLAGEPNSAIASAALGSFRFVVARGRLFERAEPDVLEAFENAIAALGEAGATVVEGSMDSVLDELAAIDRIGTFPSIEVSATLHDKGIIDLDGVDPKTRVRIEAGMGILATDYVRMTRLRQTAIRSFANAMTPDDVFVLPTTPIRAPLLSSLEENSVFHEANGLVLRNPRIANLLDCPSISLPLPVAGLPIGLMLIGRRNADRRLLEIALQTEATLAVRTN